MTQLFPDFATFIDAFRSELTRRTAQGQPLRIVFEPSRAEPAGPDEVLVGLGHWILGDETQAHRGICLNRKGAVQRFGLKSMPATVTHFALMPPDEVLDAWLATTGGPLAPEVLFERFGFIVEDASPDSTLAVIAWAMRMAGLPAAAFPNRWLAAVMEWERDGSAPDALTSWAPLLSALTHSFFDSTGKGRGIVEAWSDGLSMTAMLLEAGADPDAVSISAVPGLGAERAFVRARAFVNGEHQDYLQSLIRATRLELLVPMASAPDRSLLVDAYFAVEPAHPSGVKKVFIRSDAQNSFFGNGFSVMGLYRPGTEGTGYDMTLSCDPRRGIDLKDLWVALERLENERWGGQRPADRPRILESYAKLGTETRANEPWWDDAGRWTILGAPKRLQTGELGSRLSWNDVLETIWSCYQPLRQINVFDLMGPQTGAIRNIAECTTVQVRANSPGGKVAAQKVLGGAKWDRSHKASQAIQFTPTVLRMFAAFVERGREGRTGSVALSDLCDPRDFTHLEFSGGSAVVTRSGAFLFDDWRTADLDSLTLVADFRVAVELLAATQEIEADVDALYARAGGGQSFFRAAAGDMLKEITALRARIASVFQKADVTQASLDRRRFREALETWWGLSSKEAQLTGRLKDLQEILETAATLKTQGLAQMIGFVAIPSFVVGLLSMFPVEIPNLADALLGPWLGWPKDLSSFVLGMTLMGIVSLTLFAIALIVTRQKD
jgi:hypothetical protein